jgi:hypothetical protein
MNKILFVLFCILLSACCKQDDCNDGKLPDCIQKIIDISSTQPFLTVKMQKVDGECHYWLNTGANAWDGVEYIVNSHCDTVCVLCGFCPTPDCSKKYDFENWEIVWEP